MNGFVCLGGGVVGNISEPQQARPSQRHLPSHISLRETATAPLKDGLGVGFHAATWGHLCGGSWAVPNRNDVTEPTPIRLG